MNVSIVTRIIHSRFTGEELDGGQDRYDYFFGIQDIWDSLDSNVEPREETQRYFEAKAKAIARTELGRRIIH